MKSTSKKHTPSIVNLTVKRRYLTEREVERLMDCARKCGRYGHRDATMILIAYRHGLRASEVCARGAPSIRRRSASCPFFILATSPMPCFAGPYEESARYRDFAVNQSSSVPRSSP